MPLSVLTQTMPLDLAAAICGSEAAGVAAALLVLVAGFDAGAMEFEGAAIELDGAGEVGAVEVCVAGAGLAGVAAAAEPESISDFLLLRVRLVGVAPVSVPAAAVAGVAAGAPVAGAAPESAAAAFLLLRVFLVGVAVVSADAVPVEAPAASSDFLLFLLFFVVALSLAVAEAPEPAAAVSPPADFLDFFVFLVVLEEVSAAAVAD
jgi:hypothetical protein